MLTYIYLSYPQFFQFNILQKSWFFFYIFFLELQFFFTSAPKQKNYFSRLTLN